MTAPALKLDLFVGFPSYGGNGGISSECPSVREWYTELNRFVFPQLKKEGKLGTVHDLTIADTPITMVRNKFVTKARDVGAHLLLTIDSDMNPNLHKDTRWFKPFFDEAFHAIYNHWHKGPLVVGAPYCGPPSDEGGENVYVFQFENRGWHGDYTRMELSQFTRSEAGKMAGLSEVAALPTGLVMYDMRMFDMLEPSNLTKEQILEKYKSDKMTSLEARAALEDGWFFYEWKNQYADEKGSTEDVAATRNMAFMGMLKLGYNPLRCAWDSWAGHYKPWCVGKPQSTSIEHISASFCRAIENHNSIYEEDRDFTAEWNFSEAKTASPFPKDFPMEHLANVPKDSMRFFGTRKVFGTNVVNFLQMTSMEHLLALRKLVLEECDRKERRLNIIEVGSWLGDSAIALADPECCESLTCVDWWEGSESDSTRQFKENIGCKENLLGIFKWNINKYQKLNVHRRLPGITVMNMSSTQAASEFAGEPADIIFLDADHTYENVFADIDQWLPHLRKDGIMIGHDYNAREFPGVGQAAHEMFGSHVEEYCSLPNCSFWLVRMESFSGESNGKGNHKEDLHELQRTSANG